MARLTIFNRVRRRPGQSEGPARPAPEGRQALVARLSQPHWYL
jgi:hypothetical protein